jgi:hypothetical protein
VFCRGFIKQQPGALMTNVMSNGACYGLPKFNADVAFSIGDTHTICQDYGKVSDRIVAISDGCSSSPDTDLGARLMVMSAIALHDCIYDHAFASILAHNASRALSGLHQGLHGFGAIPSTRCLDATLLAIGFSHDIAGKQSLEVVFCGDGVAVVEFKDGRREVYVIDYACNAPYYPSYKLDAGRESAYLDMSTGIGTIKRLDIPGDVGSKIEAKTNARLLYDPTELSRVTIMTDGAMSFSSRDGSPVDHLSIINELTAFKSVEGPFVERRLNRGLKALAKRNLVQNDDITVGCMNFITNP